MGCLKLNYYYPERTEYRNTGAVEKQDLPLFFYVSQNGGFQYVYCLGNPLILKDPDGREVIVSGEESKAFFKEVKAGAKALDISVKMDKNGKLSAQYKGKGEISENGAKFMEAVNDKTVTVNVNAIKHREGSATDFMFGGMFGGNSVYGETIDGSWTSQYAIANQTVIPSELKSMDNAYGRPGQTSLHEITEAHIGGKIAMREGVSSTGTGRNSYAFTEAHGRAIPQSGNINRGTFSDRIGSWIEWQTVTNPIKLLKSTNIRP